MSKEKQLAYFFEENPFEDDVMVSSTIHDMPSKLLKEFIERIGNRYEGGISPAIRDLMWLAVQKSKERQFTFEGTHARRP